MLSGSVLGNGPGRVSDTFHDNRRKLESNEFCLRASRLATGVSRSVFGP